MSSVDRCWIKNVEVSGAEQAGLYFWSSSQCEIRRCYVHGSYGYPTQSDGYSILLQYGNCCFLVEDNIAYRTAHLIYNGSSAIATLNNYFYDTSRASTTWIQPAMDCNHGPHGLMSLWEGNIGSRFQNDGYHGSCSHQTVFRNHLNGLHSSATLERQLVDLSRGSYYNVVVGNILGDSSWNPSAYAATTYADHTLGYIYVLGWGSPDSADPTYDVGWENWTASLPDANVAATITRHANYDYYNDAVVYSDPDHSIANSLFYASKPSFFGSLTWPPIDPFTPTANSTPAKWRWDNYVAGGSVDVTLLFADTNPGTGEVEAAGVAVSSTSTLAQASLIRSSAASDYLEASILDHIFKTATYTPPAHIYVALCKSTIDDTHTGSTLPSEVSGGSYARTLCDDWSPSASGHIDNENLVLFPKATAGWGLITDVALCDAQTNGNVLVYGKLFNYKEVVTGDEMAFEAGGLDVTLD
jgi:hypothetical protein